MNRLLRPSILVLVSAGLTLGAIAYVFWPRPLENRAVPLPLAAGDQELVWLYAATNAAPWERLITAVGNVVARQRQEGSAGSLRLDDSGAFPPQTTAVPEMILSRDGTPGKLRIRWYKLTSETKTADWVQALLRRQPPPLGILGGGSSDLAIELAGQLQTAAAALGLTDRAPLLALTTATADDEPFPTERPLDRIYPDRTVRFCFTNRQMAEAVTAFIWSQEDLRPDTEPLYVTFWEDDPYSKDLNRRFIDALRGPALQAVTAAAAAEWAWQGGVAQECAWPIDLSRASQPLFQLETPVSESIPYSIGTFDRPNRWEAESANRLIEEKLTRFPDQQRPLLVIPAASQPARRFLRALIRAAPREARKFVVATGDAIPFNTIFRDRNVAWPVQDLPFPLVLFAHRNPVDAEAGFPLAESTSPFDSGEPTSLAAGTEDLLLFMDVAETLIGGAFRSGRLTDRAEVLIRAVRETRWDAERDRVTAANSGIPLFDSSGNRNGNTGGHIICLRPVFAGRQVLPETNLAIWKWHGSDLAANRTWTRRAVLRVTYDGYTQ